MFKLSRYNPILKNVNSRNVELDMFKILLVVGMIVAHVFQLLYNGDMFSRVVDMFSLFINAITFSGFLLAFGCATQLAYLRKTRDKVLMRKLMKNGLRLLVAFYISGFAYTLLVSHSLTFMEAVKILCLWRIPGYSEFLLSFAMLMPLVYILYRPLNVICLRWTKWGGVSLMSLLSTFLPYKYIIIPLLGVLVGTTRFACFPLLQYSMFFLFGIYFAKNGLRMNRNILIVSMLLTGLSLIYILIFHRIPNRCPPECLWITLPCAPIAVDWFVLSKIGNMQLVARLQRQIGIYGANTLDYLVFSNVLIFLAQDCFGRNFGFFQCLVIAVAISVCCCCYTHLKIRLWHTRHGRLVRGRT